MPLNKSFLFSVAVAGAGLVAFTPARSIAQTAPSVAPNARLDEARPAAPALGEKKKIAGWPPTGPVPRTTDGRPDLSGAWEPNAFQQNLNIAFGGVQVPFQPWAEKVFNERRATNGRDDPEGYCMPPGVPRTETTPYPWRVIQTADRVIIIYEGGAHVWREIFTDGRPHDAGVEQTWLGDSIGKWDGDTLVVDTIGFNDRSWLDAAGHPHTDALHVIERYRRLDLGHMEIEITIDDPKAYTKPWTVKTHPQLLHGELMEYICQENNKDVNHLVGK
jgi:hypothetical protein